MLGQTSERRATETGRATWGGAPPRCRAPSGLGRHPGGSWGSQPSSKQSTASRLAVVRPGPAIWPWHAFGSRMCERGSHSGRGTLRGSCSTSLQFKPTESLRVAGAFQRGAPGAAASWQEGGLRRATVSGQAERSSVLIDVEEALCEAAHGAALSVAWGAQRDGKSG